TNSAASESVRRNTKLIVSQYGHANDNSTPTFGPEMFSFYKLDVSGKPYDIDYFDRYLKGDPNGYDDAAKVQLAVMVPPDSGNDGYAFRLSTADYPLPETMYKEMYFSSDGGANTRRGDGRLDVALPKQHSGATEDSFSYDPRDPVPSIGGSFRLGGTDAGSVYKDGAADQTDVEVRQDVLVYTSEPLSTDLALIGPVEVTLFAKSSAPDTDFTAKLVSVRPDGASHNIVDGIVRARFRNGSKKPSSLIEPMQTYEYRIELGHTATVIPAGHQIRVQISSSNFPKYARNLNTGKSNEASSNIAVAQQIVLHGPEHPSRIRLPVVTESILPEDP
ncbi:MAG: CocE/NonD family hydrolase, partial [Rhodospirillaceae bacterium]|nr:CocE/NonD family hydrolase [Rhodospirillaceae bacterium]